MIECIIFDLDGTLVNSEPLCNQAMVDLVPQLSLTVDELLVRFRGRKLADIIHEIEVIVGHDLPEKFDGIYRAHVDTLFKERLEPFADVENALQALDVRMCIASSGPQKKINSALKKTRLDGFFSGRTYSSYDIQKWKPDPGLFLYAASKMEVLPQSCLVVEDSPVGIEAAISAGMLPLQFCEKNLATVGVESFSAYSEFAEKLSEMSNIVRY